MSYVYWTEESCCDVCGTITELDAYGYKKGEVQGYLGDKRTKQICNDGLQKAHAKSCPNMFLNPYARIHWATAGCSAWREEYGDHLNYTEREMESDKKTLEEWNKKPFCQRLFRESSLFRNYNPY